MSEPAQSLLVASAEDSAADSRMLVVETVGSVCWLAMDAGWMLGWRAAATLLVVAGVVAHVLAFRFTQRSVVAMAVTASMACWFGMNVAWMLADTWSVPGLLVVAKLLCVTATVLLIVAFSRSRWRPEARLRLFAGFRRLRIAFQERPKP